MLNANVVTCHKCKKCGHFQAACRLAKFGSIQTDTDSSPEDVDLGSAFLHVGAVEQQCPNDTNPWAVTLSLNGKPVNLRIDTGCRGNSYHRAGLESHGLAHPSTIRLNSHRPKITCHLGERNIQTQ